MNEKIICGGTAYIQQEESTKRWKIYVDGRLIGSCQSREAAESLARMMEFIGWCNRQQQKGITNEKTERYLFMRLALFHEQHLEFLNHLKANAIKFDIQLEPDFDLFLADAKRSHSR